MKVLHVISDHNIGGAGVLLCNLLTHLESDIKSIVALPRGSELELRIRAIGIPVLLLEHPCDRFCDRSVREISALIRQNGVDLLHANAALCARIAGRMKGIPVVYTRHCCYPPVGSERVPFLREVMKIFNRVLCNCAIATADAAARDLLRLGIPRERIRVIINGSMPVRAVGEQEKNAFLEHFGLTKEDFIIGICARLEACKGQDVFLRAAKAVLERLPNKQIRFLVVGTGSCERELCVLAESLGIADAVRFTGFVSDMAPVYRVLRVNVNCSRGTETSCLALSEGMSAGVPCVVSDYGGNPAMIGKSGAGLLYPVGDASALADALCRIIEDKEMEKAMRQAAKTRFETHYTASRMAREVGKLYRELSLSLKRGAMPLQSQSK